MGARTVLPSMAYSISIYILKYGGPPADGGHPGGRWTGGHPSGRRTGGHGGGRYTTDGHTCLRYGGREDTEGAPTWRQGRCINTISGMKVKRPPTGTKLLDKTFWNPRPEIDLASRAVTVPVTVVVNRIPSAFF